MLAKLWRSKLNLIEWLEVMAWLMLELFSEIIFLTGIECLACSSSEERYENFANDDRVQASDDLDYFD